MKAAGSGPGEQVPGSVEVVAPDVGPDAVEVPVGEVDSPEAGAWAEGEELRIPWCLESAVASVAPAWSRVMESAVQAAFGQGAARQKGRDRLRFGAVVVAIPIRGEARRFFAPSAW